MMVAINIGGASGMIGSRRVKNVRPDNYTVLLLYDAILMTKYSGKVPYGPEAFEPVAATGEAGLVLTTSAGSDVADLLQIVCPGNERISAPTSSRN